MSVGARITATALLFVRRCLAYALDCLLVFVVVIGLVQGLLWLVTHGAWFSQLRTWPEVQGWIAVSVVLPTWLYFSLAEAGLWQATIAKRLLGLRVTDLRGKRLTIPHALLRNFLKLVPWYFVHIAILAPAPSGVVPLGQLPPSLGWWWGFLVIADVLMLLYLVTALFTEGKRSIHDLIAGTCVVRERRAPQEA